MHLPHRPLHPALLAIGTLLLAAGCASTTYELSPPPAPRPAPPSPAPQDEQLPEYETVPASQRFTYEKQDVEAWARQRIWLFLGATQSSEGTDFTTGLRYGYFLYGNVGFGALVDYSDREQDTWITALAVYARPTKHFQITIAPGLEWVGGNNEPMIRTGFEYGFDIGEHLAIVPGFSFDIVSNRDNVTNLGVSLEASF